MTSPSTEAKTAVMYWDGGERAITPREKATIEEHGPSCYTVPLVPAQALDPVDPWRGLYQPARMPAPSEYGDLTHPDTPLWPDDREDALDKLVHAQGFDFHIVAGDFTEAAMEDGDELYWQELRAWNPEAPEGEWRLAWKGDTEDGPYAWFVQPMALRPEPGALAATGKQVGEVQGDALNVEQLQALISRIHSTVSLGHQTGPHAYAGEDFGRYLAEAAGDCQEIMRALASHQPGAQVPAIWVSPEQLEAHTDPQRGEGGHYLPARKRTAGKFTQPLYRNPLAQGIDLGQFHAVLTEVAAERARQEQKWGQQNHVDWTRTTATSDLAGVWPGGVGRHFKWITDYKAAGKEGHALGYFDILMEEVGEAHDEAREGNVSALREEVIQVAAVAVAWVECIDRRQALIDQRDAAPGVANG